ncbi:hypothetical protein FB45DRAFT_790640, partial [Roridomyces roridus]
MSSLTNLSLCLPRPSSKTPHAPPAIATSTIETQLPPNHIVVKVDRFGFSANNVTYQALGEQPHFRYYDFHPAPTASNASRQTHGLVPVWGFGTVVASSHPKIPLGERIYGYLAPCRYLLLPVSPSDVNKHAFYVPRPHLPAVTDRRPYNQIIRCANDPQYTATPQGEDLTMLYRPLFWTSYWFDDWLHSLRYRGANKILISSASAKTAFCAAYLFGKRRERGETRKDLELVGLTSKKNLAFTKGLRLYDSVQTYDDALPKGNAGEIWLYVDVAGNDELNARILAHFASIEADLAGAFALGLTNITPASSAASSVFNARPTTKTFAAKASLGATPTELEPFFMPEWLDIRKHQLSLTEIFERQKTAWAELMRDCVGWVRIEHVKGAEGVKSAYERIRREGVGAEVGEIWSLWDGE